MSDTEQTTESTEAATTEAPDGASREELLKAVREAGGTEAVDVEAEAAAAAEKAAPPAGEEPAKDPDPDDKISSVLRAREAAHRKRLEAEEHAARLRADAEMERQRIIEEAKAEAERVREQARLNLRDEFRRNPTATLRTLADDTQEIIDSVVKEGTPEWRMAQEARAEARKALEAANEAKSAREELNRFRAEQENERQQAKLAAARNEFLAQFATPEKAPHLHARWEPEEVFDRCDRLCREWQSDGLKLGVDFDRDTLVAYLEKQSRERFTKLAAPAQQVSAGAPAKEPGIATKVSANGSRTLSAAQGSERRTSPRPLSEMTPEEQRAALIEEVAKARRSHPDAKY